MDWSFFQAAQDLLGYSCSLSLTDKYVYLHECGTLMQDALCFRYSSQIRYCSCDHYSILLYSAGQKDWMRSCGSTYFPKAPPPKCARHNSSSSVWQALPLLHRHKQSVKEVSIAGQHHLRDSIRKSTSKYTRRGSQPVTPIRQPVI